MCSLSVSLHDCRKENHPFMTKKLPAGRTCLKMSYADWTEWIEREWIALLLKAMGFGLQCGQCWFKFHSCKGNCPPQSSKTSVPIGEQIYLLLVFSTWLEQEQPSPCDTTKADRLDWFLEEVPNADPTFRNALKEHLQIFSHCWYNVKTENLIYRNYCCMNTSHLHLPWVNVEGSTYV